MPTASEPTRSLADRIAALDPEMLTSLGLTTKAADRIGRVGAGFLPIATALALGELLDVDLRFLAGQSDRPHTPEAGTFDGVLLAAARRDRGAKEADLVRAMNVTRSQYIAITRNRHEPSLRAVIDGAQRLGVAPRELLTRGLRDGSDR